MELAVTVPGAMSPMLPPPAPLPTAEASMLETVRSESETMATAPPLAPNTPLVPELPFTEMGEAPAEIAPPDCTDSPPEAVALPALEVVIQPLMVTAPSELNTATVPP